MLALKRLSEGEWPSLRFFDECVSELDPAGDEEAAARCMNFIVRSREEILFGVSGGAMVTK